MKYIVVKIDNKYVAASKTYNWGTTDINQAARFPRDAKHSLEDGVEQAMSEAKAIILASQFPPALLEPLISLHVLELVVTPYVP